MQFLPRSLTMIAGFTALGLASVAPAREQGVIAVGDQAPDLTLQDQDGQEVQLSELWAEKPLVIYFYPKDFTPGCTAQACSFRDAEAEMQQAGLTVVGISVDTVESHRKFAEKHRLSFPLLADPDGAASQRYGTAASFVGVTMARRVTFLVGTDGKVIHVWDPVGTAGHADAVLELAADKGLLARAD